MKKLLKIVSLILALTMVLGLTACGSTGNDKILRVGMECAYTPYNWTQTDDSNGAVAIDGGGYAGGYDVEIAKIIAEGMGRELVIVKTGWGALEQAVNSGTIDAIVAGMSPLEERTVKMDFTDRYYTSDLVVIVKKDGKYAGATTLNDFAGAKITGQLDTCHYTAIDQLVGVDKQTAMEEFSTMITSLNAGTIDGYICDRAGAKSAVAMYKNFALISFAEGQGLQVDEDEIAISVGLAKGSKLVTEMNTIINGITEEERVALMEEAVSHQPMNVE